MGRLEKDTQGDLFGVPGSPRVLELGCGPGACPSLLWMCDYRACVLASASLGASDTAHCPSTALASAVLARQGAEELVVTDVSRDVVRLAARNVTANLSHPHAQRVLSGEVCVRLFSCGCGIPTPA